MITTNVNITNLTQAAAVFEKMVAERDIEGLGSLYAKDAWLMPAGLPIIKGREQILQFFENMISIADYNMNFTLTDIQEVGNLGFEVTSWVLKMTNFTGNPTLKIGNSVVIWKRIDGVWQMWRDAFVYSDKMADRLTLYPVDYHNMVMADQPANTRQ
jgi:ketosteroid isomerase-like protein